MKTKFIALILIPIIALATLNITYSLWHENLTITGTITTGRWGTEIGSCKVLYPHGYDEQMTISDQLGNQILQITIQTTTESWYMWVGLVITNDGILTANTKTPIYEHSHDQNYFTTDTYFYGPFNGGDFNIVWDGTQIGDLPSPESAHPPFATPSQTPPVTLETSQKAVIWTLITFETTDPTIIGETIQLSIDCR